VVRQLRSVESAVKLAEVRKMALSLPETTEAPHFHYSSFRVRGKIFATVPPEGTHVHVFVGEEQREQALALDPSSIEKLLWGKRVVGLRVALKMARPAMVAGLLSQAWSGKAPKRLAASRRVDANWT
jgi:hypothetical protein